MRTKYENLNPSKVLDSKAFCSERRSIIVPKSSISARVLTFYIYRERTSIAE